MRLALSTFAPALLALVCASAQEGGDAVPRVFQLSASCARCHDASPNARALTLPDGTDASPHGLWQGTMMAQSFLDPYWRAKMAREVEVGALARADVEGLCLRCHAPAAHHHDRLLGQPARGMEELRGDAAALDGVNCTVCHRTTAEGLGEPRTFDRSARRGDGAGRRGRRRGLRRRRRPGRVRPCPRSRRVA
jgi:hypothetical protein